MIADQYWIFSVRYYERPSVKLPIDRFAVVGQARASTVEAALHLAKVPEEIRREIRAHATVRDFIEGRLDQNTNGYYVHDRNAESTWVVCIGPVHEALVR